MSEKPCSHCWGAVCFKLKFGGLRWCLLELLSLGLRIHDRRSRGRRSDLRKVPKEFISTASKVFHGNGYF